MRIHTTEEYLALEDLGDYGREQNTGLRCWECGDPLKEIRVLGQPYRCEDCNQLLADAAKLMV